MSYQIIKSLFNCIMDNIININDPNLFKKLIKQNKIEFDQFIDQINNPIHYLAYHSKNNLIKSIPEKILSELIAQPNNEGDTICHIAAKLNNTKLFNLTISHILDIVYQQNDLGYAPLYYLLHDKTFIKKFTEQNHIRDHWINSTDTLVDFYILESDIEMVKHLLDKVDMSAHGIFTIIESEDNNTDTKIKLLELIINKQNDIVNKINEKTFLSPLII